MRYFLAHLDDRPGQRWQDSDPDEEIYVIALGEPVATAVPLGALGRLMPMLHERVEGRPPACCAACGESLPARAQARLAPHPHGRDWPDGP